MGALILVVDDSPAIRRQIQGVLRELQELEGVDEFLEAGDGLQAFKLLVDRKPDLVVCDLIMPTFDGLKFLALRATRPELANIPVIMLTAEGDATRKVEVFELGASDYVTKPFDDEELLARVRVHYRLKVLQDELREANKRLEALADTDGLTGLFNRRYFDALLLRELQRTARYKTPVGVVLLDIDHFKYVNDTYGHPMGDEVLRNVAKIVSAGVRVTDSAARYGGEEIAIVFTQTTAQGVMEVTERLRSQLEKFVHEYEGHTVRRTASFGVGLVDGRGVPLTPLELVERADRALYRAKHNGRNQVVIWSPELDGEPTFSIRPEPTSSRIATEPPGPR
ncbi:MAG TPA: diguanylate cyclase [Polyangiaceae bacterium]|jgi:two-component system cell cycle response regulator|nr:diguanylate cyclase [Polyangiaceae bacterium]